MNSPASKTTIPSNSLLAQLQQIGLRALPAGLDDFLARATKARWSPLQILEQMAQAEVAERSRRSLERRLRLSGIKRFKPMADFEWNWPSKIEREVIERALTLDFIPENRNLILVGRNGLGKTMIAQNLCHAAVLAGYSVLFRSAASLLEELHRQAPEGRRRKLRTYANVGLLCIDEVGYLSFDDKAADLLYEVINRRYERKSVIVTTNRPFKEWNEVDAGSNHSDRYAPITCHCGTVGTDGKRLATDIRRYRQLSQQPASNLRFCGSSIPNVKGVSCRAVES